MRRLKSRDQFLKEAKIRDVIFKQQAKAIKDVWGEVYLDYEEVDPTENINQGKWKLSDEDKMVALSSFFNCDIKSVLKLFSDLSDDFAFKISESLDFELLKSSSLSNRDKIVSIFENFNIKNPTIEQVSHITLPIFRKLDVNQTISSEMISKDEGGRPIRDSEGNMIKVSKNPGDPIFTRNLVNLSSFIEDYNRCYEDKVNFRFSTDLDRLISTSQDSHNTEYEVDYNIFNRDVYLQIEHKPKYILNMSISKFYSSCQHLYSGGYRHKVLANVFDPNSIPAFLIFETPILQNGEVISDHLPLCRMMIRNIDNQSGDRILYFDRCYPDRMKDSFDKIITKYSGNKSTEVRKYTFTPDLPLDSQIDDPYMDRLSIERKPYIGINTKSLILSRDYDWSKVVVSPKAKIKELVIETPSLPENFEKLNLNLDWIKFKYITIKDFSKMSNVMTKSISFEKCKFDVSIFNNLKDVSPDLKKLEMISCDFNLEDFIEFQKLEDLKLIYTLDSLDEVKVILDKNKSIKNLSLSGDLIRNKSDKSYINSLKSSGMKINLVGPVVI